MTVMSIVNRLKVAHDEKQNAENGPVVRNLITLGSGRFREIGK